jgi:hypothetical protein
MERTVKTVLKVVEDALGTSRKLEIQTSSGAGHIERAAPGLLERPFVA